MKVAFLGFVSALEEYTDRKTGQVVRSVAVASTNQMLKVKISDDQHFDEMDSVLVAGDIKVFERNFYIENPVIRLSTADDRLFMQGKPSASASGPGAQDLRSLPKDLSSKTEKAA